MLLKTINNDIWRADIDTDGNIDLYIKTPARKDDHTIPLYLCHKYYEKNAVEYLLEIYSKPNRFDEIKNEGDMMRFIHEWYLSITPGKPSHFRSRITKTLHDAGYSDNRIEKFLNTKLDVIARYYCVVMTVAMSRPDYTLPYSDPAWTPHRPYSF